MHCTYCSGYQPPPLSSKMHFRLLDALNWWIVWVVSFLESCAIAVVYLHGYLILHSYRYFTTYCSAYQPPPLSSEMHFRLLDALNLNIVHWLHSRTLALFCYTFYTAQVCVKIRSGAMERNILEQFPLHLTLAGQFEICLKYIWNIFDILEIYLKHIWNIFDIWNLHYISWICNIGAIPAAFYTGRAMPKWWEQVEKVTRLPYRVKNPDR